MIWETSGHRTFCDVKTGRVTGRYLIRRRKPFSREFVLVFNGQPTKRYGTVDELKKVVEQCVNDDTANEPQSSD